jgi:hypothetical protein
MGGHQIIEGLICFGAENEGLAPEDSLVTKRLQLAPHCKQLDRSMSPPVCLWRFSLQVAMCRIFGDQNAQLRRAARGSAVHEYGSVPTIT